jgi:hypothetical protein
MVVPAEQSDENAHTVVHEYGHHVDRSTPVTGVREPNGTPVWWRARGMERLVRVSSVATSYVLAGNGASPRSSPRTTPSSLWARDYNIGWLPSPDATVLAAVTFDLGLGPEPRSPRRRRSSRCRSLARRPRAEARCRNPFSLLGPAGA